MASPTPRGDEREHNTAPGAVVLLVDCEPALAGLLGEWLRPEGFEVRVQRTTDGAAKGSSTQASHGAGPGMRGMPGLRGLCSTSAASAASTAALRPALVLAELAHPERSGVDSLRHRLEPLLEPGGAATPIIVLSSMFFASVECCGPVAQRLGVDAVLPTPATREALLALVARLLPPAFGHAGP